MPLPSPATNFAGMRWIAASESRVKRGQVLE
jgi:hypothetical protein